MAFDRLRKNREGRVVILDSNAVMMLFECSINLEGELQRLLGLYHIVIPSVVLDELKVLMEKGRGKKRINAKASFKLAQNYEIMNVNTDKNCDDALVDLSVEKEAVVVTNDKELRRKLKKRSVQAICLRGKNHLMLC